MGMFDLENLRKLDSFTRDKKPGSTKLGGVCQISVWVFAFVYTIVYIVQTSKSEWPTEVSSEPFPMSSGEIPVEFASPEFTCMAPEGCYYFQDSASSAKCIKIEKDDKLPAINLLYSPFPQFSVLVPGSSSMTGLGYSITKVKKYQDTLETETTPPKDHLIPQGMSTMNVARTLGSPKLNGDQEVVDTWTTTLTTLTSFIKAHGCCNANTVYVRDATTGDLVEDNAAKVEMALCGGGGVAPPSNWWSTHLNSPSYYTKILVQNPVHASVIFGLIGGWIGTVTIAAGVLYFAYMKLYGPKKPANQPENLELSKV